MLLDYMARQVVVSMFPVFKEQWALSDAKLGALVSAVVSLARRPCSACRWRWSPDRYSRVKAIAVMAVVWSARPRPRARWRAATSICCWRASSWAAGEAAYGAAAASLIAAGLSRPRSGAAAIGIVHVGRALRIGARRDRRRRSRNALRLAGRVLGGGASRAGPRRPLLLLRDYKTVALSVPTEDGARPLTFLEGVAQMFRSRSVLSAYAANGILIFVTGTMTAWLPTFFNRVYGLPAPAASVRAAGAILAAASARRCAASSSVASRGGSQRALFLGPAVIATCVALILGFAFHLGPGRLQFALILLGSVGLAGTQGPMTAAIASACTRACAATAIAMLAVVQNIVGLAAGSLITGMLSDRLGIAHALAVVPLLALGSAVIFVAGARSYVREAESATAEEPQSSSRSPSLSPPVSGPPRSNTQIVPSRVRTTRQVSTRR